MRTVFLALFSLLLLAVVLVAAVPSLRDDAKWWWVNRTVGTADYADYLAAWPQGRHAEEARSRLEEKAWDAARQADTLAAFNAYLKDYPEGRHAADARARIQALLTDDASFAAAQQQGSRQAIQSFLERFPGHRREAEARAALRDMEGQDIVDLLEQGKLEAQTRGAGIESVKLQLRRKVSYELTVRIPIGTYFVSRNQAAQSMVVTDSVEVTLRDDAWEEVSVEAACADMPLDVPGEEDSFRLRRSPAQKELARLMPALRQANAGFAVRQAAVWIVTDDATYDALGTLQVTVGFSPFGGSRAILEEDAARAMQVVDQAGIDITTRAIWDDRAVILEGLEDVELKAWLRQRARRP